MAQQQINEWTTWEFGEDEERLAYNFGELNLMALQNERAKVMQEKMTLTPDMAQETVFMLKHEYLRGKLDILSGLITVSQQYQKQLELDLERRRLGRPMFGPGSEKE